MTLQIISLAPAGDAGAWHGGSGGAASFPGTHPGDALPEPSFWVMHIQTLVLWSASKLPQHGAGLSRDRGLPDRQHLLFYFSRQTPQPGLVLREAAPGRAMVQFMNIKIDCLYQNSGDMQAFITSAISLLCFY